jgi:hypothetical protein
MFLTVACMKNCYASLILFPDIEAEAYTRFPGGKKSDFWILPNEWEQFDRQEILYYIDMLIPCRYRIDLSLLTDITLLDPGEILHPWWGFNYTCCSTISTHCTLMTT